MADRTLQNETCVESCCSGEDLNRTMSSLLTLLEPPQLLNQFNRSLSPWTYREHKDVNMFPSRVQVAVCNTMRCVDGSSRLSGCSGLRFFNSVPLNHSIPVVFRRSCAGGRYRLEQGSFPVTVGCTCVLAHM
ncbi:interleukin-25-like isoform X2 [Lepisosteus oculatus]|uniref:interleukin-25-like isoform X2 n=1 Tax=Lepisosteus oculatus TaxID=7918 RepID=UPI0037198D8D